MMCACGGVHIHLILFTITVLSYGNSVIFWQYTINKISFGFCTYLLPLHSLVFPLFPCSDLSFNVNFHFVFVCLFNCVRVFNWPCIIMHFNSAFYEWGYCVTNFTLHFVIISFRLMIVVVYFNFFIIFICHFVNYTALCYYPFESVVFKICCCSAWVIICWFSTIHLALCCPIYVTCFCFKRVTPPGQWKVYWIMQGL